MKICVLLIDWVNLQSQSLKTSLKVSYFFNQSDSHLPKKNCFIYFIESPLKMMKNAFYFILKAFFVLKIFKFLS